ncbi:MAG: hypothetical protein LBK25_08865 [Treponema sp.]|jgi:hypothetical protein|nr:hypothetical protein [Treponema sp.]
MEKFGMDRRCANIRTGLLVLLLFSVSLFAHAGDDEQDLPQPLLAESVPLEEVEADETLVIEQERLFIEVALSSEQPVVNIPWTISILVDYSRPEYVGVSPPEFPEALHLDEMRMEPLTRENKSRWTAVRWTFIPQRPEVDEPIHLGSFQITTPGKTAFTEAIDVSILSRAPAVKNYYPRLVWDKIQTPFEVGVDGSLLLRLLDWKPSLPIPKISLTPPEQTILEELPLTQADVARSAILRLSLIPLTEGEVTIPRLHFKSQGVNLEIPSLTIPVVLSVKDAISPQTPEPISTEDTVSPSIAVRFPEKALGIPKIFSRTSVNIATQAKTLWGYGEKAESLALIRKNERDDVFGFTLIPLRKDMEQALDLVPSHDEMWIPKKVCLIAALCCLAGLTVLLIKGRLKQRRKNTFFASVLVMLTICGLVGFWSPLRRKTAVFHASDVYSVPELKGAVMGQISEGQWAMLRSTSGEWAFVEADGLSGWILLEKAIFY